MITIKETVVSLAGYPFFICIAHTRWRQWGYYLVVWHSLCYPLPFRICPTSIIQFSMNDIFYHVGTFRQIRPQCWCREWLFMVLAETIDYYTVRILLGVVLTASDFQGSSEDRLLRLGSYTCLSPCAPLLLCLRLTGNCYSQSPKKKKKKCLFFMMFYFHGLTLT